MRRIIIIMMLGQKTKNFSNSKNQQKVGTSTRYFIFCFHMILPDKKTLRFTEGNRSQFTRQRWRQIQGLLIIVFYAKL